LFGMGSSVRPEMAHYWKPALRLTADAALPSLHDVSTQQEESL
jgi:hypothetical protein